MHPSSDEIPEWKDFPNGLSVLLVDGDVNALYEISEKLRSYHFTVTTFSEVDDAVAAIKSHGTVFHVALVEANINNDVNGFRILDATKCLPIIMTIESENIAIMMQGIALGAADFWVKPLTEEKLRNVWQHVVRKVVSSEDDVLLESLKSVRGALDTILHSTSLWGVPKIESSGNDVKLAAVEVSTKKLAVSEEEPLGATSQSSTMLPYAEVGRIRTDLGKVSPYDQNMWVKVEKEDLLSNSLGSVGMSHTDIELEDRASIKMEFDDSMDDVTISTGSVVYGGNGHEVELGASVPSPFSTSAQDINLDESLNSGEVHDGNCGLENNMSLAQVSKVADNSSAIDIGVPSITALNYDSRASYTDYRRNDQNTSEQVDQGNKSVTTRKKVDWTPELHRLFVQAVEQLGVERAIPSKILEVMGVKCLTRHNIASHLQKYRSHRKHIHLARDAGTAWNQRQVHDTSSLSKPRLGSSHGTPLPIQPRLLPGYQGIPCLTSGNPFVAHLHVWGHPVMDQSSGHVVHQPLLGTSLTWQGAHGSYLQQPVICAPGMPYYFPAMTLPPTSGPSMEQVLNLMPTADKSIPTISVPSATESDGIMDFEAVSASHRRPSEFHPSKQIVDAAISEALSNPSLPLPLGLKSPSIESVMAELQQEGLDMVRLIPS
ncbi:hypothetical protein O6H91_09G016800 [Diphasiastrum complanatum]|uniref:Uncharacterized protein n=1 Tax=Diphasiastrum complanatum TaxID=34168 RepID=A0ACC2CLL9_DIPCM|nr:hypothetical protein O6H91_09G016800 [Diphasiastrum complanatum]